MKHLQFLIPPKNQVSRSFLKAVLKGEKKLFKKREVEMIEVSKWEEISVKALWEELKNDELFNIYFQDSYPLDRFLARGYFFAILHKVYPEYLKWVLDHARNERYGSTGSRQELEVIEANDEWYKALQEMPFVSRK